jgi:signal transduction histidine kinase
LHDGAQQRVVTMVLSLRMLAAHVDGPARDRVEHAACEAENLLHALRQLARGIHPAVVADSGLLGAFTDLAEEHPLIGIRVVGQADPGVSPTAETLSYGIVAALVECAESASARALSIAVSDDDTSMTIDVVHDGTSSLDDSTLESASAQFEALNGRLHHERELDHWRLRLEVPCES